MRPGRGSGCSVERSPEENVPPVASRALGEAETRVVPYAREPGCVEDGARQPWARRLRAVLPAAEAVLG